MSFINIIPVSLIFITTLFVRFTLGSLFFWLILCRTEGNPQLKTRQGLTLIVMGGIGYASMSGLYLTSVSYIPASLAALMLYTYPVQVPLLILVTKQESFSPAKIRGVILPTWLGILGIAFFCTILAMFTFFYGVKAIGPTSSSVIRTLEPIMTIFFAALLFHERLTLLQGLGGILVLIGGLRAVNHPKLAFLRETLYDRGRI